MMLRHRALRIPLIYLLAIAIVGLSLTAVLVRYELNEDIAKSQLATSGQAQALSRELSEGFAIFYGPTVAGEGFANASVQESRSTGTPEAELLAGGFTAFASPFVAYLGPALLDYQLAPDGIVTYSAKPEQNAAALRHNLFLDDARRDDVLAAVAARSPVVSGPMELKQGGLGLIIRQAIFVRDSAPFPARFTARTGLSQLPAELEQVPNDFWGFATTVVDVEAFVSQVNLAGLTPEQVALQPVLADGTLGLSILGTLAGGVERAVTERIELPDGTQWQLTAAVPDHTVWHHWMLILSGVAVTVVVMLLAAWVYRQSKRYRLGYTFSDSIVDLTTRQQVLDATSRFITSVYPRIQGQVETPPPNSLHAAIPERNAVDDLRGVDEVHLWPIRQGGRVRATIPLQRGAPYVATEVADVIGIISRMLGATLGSLEHQEDLQRQTTVDQLTDLFNRRQFQPSFEDLAETATARNLWLAVGVADIDNFKGINDSFGHLFGDEVLKQLGHALGDAVRGSDTVFRFGGDEFVILALLDTEEQALGLFTRVQAKANASLSDMTPDGRPATISVGYSCCPGSLLEPMNELLAKADRALYRAKAAGRNRVEDWASQGSTTGQTVTIG